MLVIFTPEQIAQRQIQFASWLADQPSDVRDGDPFTAELLHAFCRPIEAS